MFENLNEDLQGVEEQQDRLGGFTPFETGIYNAIVKAVYITDSQTSKSKCANIVLDIDGKEFTDRVWFLRGADGKPFYEKDGKKIMLPGFETINDLCLVVTGHPLSENSPQEKVLKVWDSESRSEKEKNLPVLVNLLGKKVTVAIQKEIVNKQEKDEATGKYVDTNEERTVNTLVKSFHFDTGKTVVELQKKVDLPPEDLFKAQWANKNTGNTRNSFKSVSGAAPASGGGAPSSSGGGSAGKSLFGN